MALEKVANITVAGGMTIAISSESSITTDGGNWWPGNLSSEIINIDEDVSALKLQLLGYINRNPGKDAIDIAHAFGLGIWEATELTHSMMREGLLRYQ